MSERPFLMTVMDGKILKSTRPEIGQWTYPLRIAEAFVDYKESSFSELCHINRIHHVVMELMVYRRLNIDYHKALHPYLIYHEILNILVNLVNRANTRIVKF